MNAEDTLREVLVHLDEAAELVRTLRDPRLDAYVLAELEGSHGPAGYLGKFARDYVEDALEDITGFDPSTWPASPAVAR